MTDEQLYERLRSLLADAMRVAPEEIDLEASNETLPGWDSLSHLNLIAAIEQDLAVRFSREEITACLSLRALLTAVAGKTAAATGG